MMRRVPGQAEDRCRMQSRRVKNLRSHLYPDESDSSYAANGHASLAYDFVRSEE